MILFLVLLGVILLFLAPLVYFLTYDPHDGLTPLHVKHRDYIAPWLYAIGIFLLVTAAFARR